MWTHLRALLFPRACIGCDRDDLLLCGECARAAGDSRRVTLAGLEAFSCRPYAGALKAAIAEFKSGRRGFALDLAALASPYVDETVTLVPIPTTRRRIATRGFDQTALVARILARTRRIGVSNVLARAKGAAQQGRSRRERLAAIGRFRVRRTAGPHDPELVLFDDVLTTGATLVDAAHTLETAGFVVAGALTLAWAPDFTS